MIRTPEDRRMAEGGIERTGERRGTARRVYRFPTLSTLLLACRAMEDYAAPADAYRDGNGAWYLVTEGQGRAAALEFGDAAAEDPSYIAEHCRLVCRTTAIRTLAPLATTDDV